VPPAAGLSTGLKIVSIVGGIVLGAVLIAVITGGSGFASLPSFASCSSGYYKFNTSEGHCCPEGYPYWYEGSCWKCPRGYFVYPSSSEGRCCQEGYPYYYDGSCWKCPMGYHTYQTSGGHCCREGFYYYYNGVCNSQPQGSGQTTSPGTTCANAQPGSAFWQLCQVRDRGWVGT
jgi:hypothetical protein